MAPLDDRTGQTKAISRRHEDRVSEVRGWFASLPSGRATMDLSATDDQNSIIDIRPEANRNAAPITVVIRKLDGFANFLAGPGYRTDDTEWPVGLPLAEFCQAVASGALTVEERLWGVEVSSVKGILNIAKLSKVDHNITVYSLRKEFQRLVLGRLLSNAGRRVTRYPPY